MRLRNLTAAICSMLLAADAHAIVLYRISGISNINLPAWSLGDGAISANMSMCVYTTLLGAYSVTVSSPGGYVLTSGGNTIPYTLRWEDSGAGNLGSNGGTALTNGVALTNRGNPNSYLFADDCSGGSPTGPTARLYVNITNAAMTAALAGVYSGTITILIGP